MLCAGREEIVRVTVNSKEVRHRLGVELRKKGQGKFERVLVSRNKKDGCYLLFIKPKEEGEHLLYITVNHQRVQNSPFCLLVNNRDYYCSTFKQPVKTVNIRYPRHIAFSSNGDMFVTSTSTDSVHVYDRNGQKKKEIGEYGSGDLQFNCPRGIAINAKVAFVSDSGNHRIQKFSTHGKFLCTFGSYEYSDCQLHYPYGLTIGPDELIYVSNSGNNQIVVFNLHVGGRCLHNIDVSTCVKCPEGLAISAEGNLHVTGRLSNNYAVFSSTGELVTSHDFCHATDVAIDAAGFVFAVAYTNENNSFAIFNTQGDVIHTIHFNRPWGVAIAPDGSVWVAGYNRDKLWKF